MNFYKIGKPNNVDKSILEPYINEYISLDKRKRI